MVPWPMHKNYVTPEIPYHPFVFPPSFQGHLTPYSTNLVRIFLPLHANISNETAQQDPFPLDSFDFGDLAKHLTLAAHQGSNIKPWSIGFPQSFTLLGLTPKWIHNIPMFFTPFVGFVACRSITYVKPFTRSTRSQHRHTISRMNHTFNPGLRQCFYRNPLSRGYPFRGGPTSLTSTGGIPGSMFVHRS